jgi:hypothetical protein
MSKIRQDLRFEAQQHFREARKEAFVNQVLSLLSGKPRDLLSFREVQQRLGLHHSGVGRLETVPIKNIVGSEGRYHDFDREFLPLHSATEDRWLSLDAAFHRMDNVPPVELYKVGDVYFVRDGNHRISVARRHGAKYIDAYVIEVPSRVKLDPDIDTERLLVEQEHLQFLERTQLDKILGIDIKLTAPGAYDALQRHIEGHQYFLAKERGAPVSFEEAAKSWYENVYLPTVRVIEQTGILERFPGRTAGDLYIWVLEHHYYLRERYGEGVSLADAAQSFASRFGRKPWHKLRDWFWRQLARLVGSILAWFRK